MGLGWGFSRIFFGGEFAQIYEDGVLIRRIFLGLHPRELMADRQKLSAETFAHSIIRLLPSPISHFGLALLGG